MGIIYYALNTKSKKAYELGKGAWILLVTEPDSNMFHCLSLEDMTRRVHKVINSGGWEEKCLDDTEYHRKIAESLCELGTTLELVNDSSWDDPLEGYVLVGDRYT